MLSVGVNKGVYDKLSAGDQQVIAAACMAGNNEVYSEFVANNGNALDTLVNEHGVLLKEFPNDVWDGFGDVSEEVVAEVASGDDIGKRVYESYIKARKNAGGWTTISEQAYTIARDRVLGA